MPEIEHIAVFTSQYITSNHVHSAEVLHVREVKAGCEEWSHHIEQLTETLIQLKCPQKEAVFFLFFYLAAAVSGIHFHRISIQPML